MVSVREEYILNELNSKGTVSVRELSNILQCSEVTIRNDIKRMEEKELLIRKHGGAVKKEERLSLSIRPGNVYKRKDEKVRIANKAFEYIKDKDTIFIDDSSIGYYLAKRILEEDYLHIVVITNSLAVATILSNSQNIVLYMIIGQIGGKLPSAVGDLAIESILKFKADKAFISAHGVNFKAGVTSVGSPQMQIKKAVLDISDKVYLMVDSSKFGGGYVLVVCPLSKITKTITDIGLSSENRELAKKYLVNLDIV